jgi:hypothetical protein
MKYIFLLITLIINISTTYAAELTCSIKGTRIHYINGIGNSDKDVILARATLRKHFEEYPKDIDKTGIVSFDYTHNHTFGEIDDFIESAAQDLSSMAKVHQINISVEDAYVMVYSAIAVIPQAIPLLAPLRVWMFGKLLDFDLKARIIAEQKDVDNIESDFKKVLEGDSKLIIVSHSQGNFFTNRALEELQQDLTFNYSKYEKIISNVRFASPEARAVAYNSSFVLNDKDRILKVRVGDDVHNFDLIEPHPAFDLRESDKGMNHSFIQTYFFDLADEFQYTDQTLYNEHQSLTDLREFSIDAIDHSALSLARHPNCPRAIINYTLDDLMVNFDSTDPENPLVKDLIYIWSLGDGTEEKSISSKTFSHLYPESGTYTVSLRVTDSLNTDFGEEAYMEKEITIGTDLRRCYGAPGKYHLNPNGMPGGFIADTAVVASTVTLNNNVSICGSTQVLGNSSIEASQIWQYSEVWDSTVIDSLITADSFHITDSIISNNSQLKFTDDSVFDGSISMQGSISNSILSGKMLGLSYSEITDTTIVTPYASLSDSKLINCTFSVVSEIGLRASSSTVTDMSLNVYRVDFQYDTMRIYSANGDLAYDGLISNY